MADKLTEPKFKQRLLSRYFVRLHMVLILGAVGISGVASSKLLLMAGLHSLMVRYPIAVAAGYGVFFMLIRLWLWYVGISPTERRRLSESRGGSAGSSSSSGGGISVDLGSGSGSGGGSGWKGFGGGGSGGGGASDSWAEAATRANFLAAAEPAPPAGGGSFELGGMGSGSTGGGKGSGGGLDIDLGDDGIWAIVALALLIVLIAGIFGSAAYLIYQAPAIFGEAAFDAALASGLARASRGMSGEDWKGSVLKATWIPFVLILAAATAFGWAAHKYCPAATRVTEVFTVCR